MVSIKFDNIHVQRSQLRKKSSPMNTYIFLKIYTQDMKDNMYRAENFQRGPLNEVKEMHLCIFFYSTAFSHYIAGHFMSST